MIIYDTKEEKRQIDVIKHHFPTFKIVNPKKWEHSLNIIVLIKKKLYDFDFYIKEVEKCDIVCFTKFKGVVTAGVGKEVNHALKLNKKVYEIVNNKIIETLTPVKYLSPSQTRELYGWF